MAEQYIPIKSINVDSSVTGSTTAASLTLPTITIATQSSCRYAIMLNLNTNGFRTGSWTITRDGTVIYSNTMNVIFNYDLENYDYYIDWLTGDGLNHTYVISFSIAGNSTTYTATVYYTAVSY